MLTIAGPPRPIRIDEAAPALSAGEAHVWIVRLSALSNTADIASATLNETERARARNFRFDRDRLLYMLGRTMLRRILSTYLDARPADIPIHAGRHGKPALGPPSADMLHFNVSHSGDLALYAITLDGPIGVDVEQIRAVPDLDGVADLTMSPRERGRLANLDEPERLSFFHAAWARKEAYLKALGDGLMRSPTEIEFGALLGEPGEVIRDAEDAHASERWRAIAWQPEADFWSALVTTISTNRVSIIEIIA